MPNPLETFIIKNRQSMGIVIKRNKRALTNQRKCPENMLKKYRQKGTKILKHCNNAIPCLYSASPCKLEYILNPIYPLKDKDMKKANKLNTIQDKNNTQKKHRLAFMIQNLK